MKIVYSSKTGHTEQYANMLAKELKIECISIKDYKQDEEKIIYMGWISANLISKYKNIDKSNLICTAAVGMGFETKDVIDNLVKANNIKEKFFYLQGGLDYSKLNVITRFAFKLAGKMMAKSNKEEDKRLSDIFINGGNFVKEENLKNIIKYIKSI